MEDGAGEDCRVNSLDSTYQLQACATEFDQNLVNRALVVLRVVRLPIAQAGRCKC